MTFGDGNNSRKYYQNKGQLAERAALSLLRHVFPDKEIQDVRNAKEWQRKEVDYIVILEQGRKKVEVKYDKYLGGDNFCFEPLRIRHNTPPNEALYLGWSIRSEAHLFLMYHEPTRTMYCVYHRDLIIGLQQYAIEVGKSGMFLKSIATDNKRTTINIYVPQRLTPHTVYVYSEDKTWHVQPHLAG